MSPSSLSLAHDLVATLPSGRGGLFNPWRDRCPHDASGNGPEARLARLALHLDCAPEFILVGEAPGYKGCRYSGIAFTSERLLGEMGVQTAGAVRHPANGGATAFAGGLQALLRK